MGRLHLLIATSKIHEHRDLPPDLGDAIEVEFGSDDADRVGRLGDHGAPRIDDHRAPEGW